MRRYAKPVVPSSEGRYRWTRTFAEVGEVGHWVIVGLVVWLGAALVVGLAAGAALRRAGRRYQAGQVLGGQPLARGDSGTRTRRHPIGTRS